MPSEKKKLEAFDCTDKLYNTEKCEILRHLLCKSTNNSVHQHVCIYGMVDWEKKVENIIGKPFPMLIIWQMKRNSLLRMSYLLCSIVNSNSILLHNELFIV